MGRWLDRLDAEKNRKTRPTATDRTDTTLPLPVLSVLSVPHVPVSEKFSPDPDGLAERVAIMEHDTGIPRAWADGLARLSTMPAPETWGRDWREVRDGLLRFADELAGPWLAQAVALGWRVNDLFGVHPDAPTARMDCRGAATFLGRAKIVAITDKTITVETRPGNKLQIGKPATAGGVPIWEFTPNA